MSLYMYLAQTNPFQELDKVSEKVRYGGVGKVIDLSDGAELGEIAAIVVNVLMGVTFSVGVVATAYAMIMFILSKGEPEKVARARDAFFWGVIAMIIAILLLALRRIIFQLFGVTTEGIAEGVPNL